jgi:hypothetical protein
MRHSSHIRHVRHNPHKQQLDHARTTARWRWSG